MLSHRTKILFLGVFVAINSAHPEPVAVRYAEGSVRGYLALRSPNGKLLAAGDLIQMVHHDTLTARLFYRFKDGSVDDETAVFTQKGRFRLVSDHKVQRGPMFPNPSDINLVVKTGQVTVKYKGKVETTHMDLPEDLSNGIMIVVVKNIPRTEETQLSFVAATPKPRLIHLTLKPDGTEPFQSAGRTHRALRFVVHVDLGGIMGIVAPMIGKEPPDSHVWISADSVPGFIKSETPLYLGGPMLTTEQVGPDWPQR